jgi:hypothetical protein
MESLAPVAELPARMTRVEHRGARILSIDYSGITAPERLRDAVEAVGRFVRRQPEDSVLCLFDLSGVPYSVEAVLVLREAAILNARWVRARAVVGLSPMAGMSCNVITYVSGRPMECFDSEAAARDWLARYA